MSATATLPVRPERTTAWSRMDDEALAGRAAAGDNGAFGALYERYHGPLLGYTRSILRDLDDANDATQNALENALRALPSRDASRPLRPWLYKIAHNEAITLMRRRRPQIEMQPAFEPTVPGPEVDAEQRGRLDQLVDDLQSLPERQRGALVMRELNGLSYEEIGTALGMTIEAARRAVFDARSALHAAVDGRDTACTSVRVSISDGDRRSLRARGIRAHLRSCNDCASFQRSIGARRADLHLLAPWVSGVAAMSALGIGAGSGGGALLAAGSGATAAAGGGIGWASLPAIVKGLAVAAAVAGTGTAAVEIKHAAQPQERSSQAQVRSGSVATNDAARAALRAAARAASAARAAAPGPAASRAGDRVRSTSSVSRANVTSRPTPSTSAAPALAPPAPVATTRPSTPATPKPQTAALVTAQAPPPSKQESALTKLQTLQEQVRQAFADAQSLAGDGSRDGLALATGMLDATLGPLKSAIDKVLATLGLAPLQTTATAPAPSAPQTTTSNVLAPVQSVLTGIQSLVQQLLGRG